MPSVLPRLSSRQHPIVRAFRDLAGDRRSGGDILLDGTHLIREALEARLPVRTVLVSTQFLARADPDDRALVRNAADAGAAVHEASAAVLDAASPVRTTSGIVALAAWSPAPVAAAFTPAPALAIGLVDVQDPGNVGAAIRSADGLNATGVIAIDRTADPSGWKALRGAMGSTFRLPVARSAWDDALAAARLAGVQLLATLADGAAPLGEVDLTQPTLTLVGNEGAGLPAYIVARADQRVTIPMRPRVNSLNVAVTAAVVLYEAHRQRKLGIRNS